MKILRLVFVWVDNGGRRSSAAMRVWNASWELKGTAWRRWPSVSERFFLGGRALEPVALIATFPHSWFLSIDAKRKSFYALISGLIFFFQCFSLAKVIRNNFWKRRNKWLLTLSRSSPSDFSRELFSVFWHRPALSSSFVALPPVLTTVSLFENRTDHLIADEFYAELADGMAYVAGHDDEARPVMVHSAPITSSAPIAAPFFSITPIHLTGLPHQARLSETSFPEVVRSITPAFSLPFSRTSSNLLLICLVVLTPSGSFGCWSSLWKSLYHPWPEM